MECCTEIREMGMRIVCVLPALGGIRDSDYGEIKDQILFIIIIVLVRVDKSFKLQSF